MTVRYSIYEVDVSEKTISSVCLNFGYFGNIFSQLSEHLNSMHGEKWFCNIFLYSKIDYILDCYVQNVEQKTIFSVWIILYIL